MQVGLRAGRLGVEEESDGRREYREIQPNWEAFGEWCEKIMEWKLPLIFGSSTEYY